MSFLGIGARRPVAPKPETPSRPLRGPGIPHPRALSAATRILGNLRRRPLRSLLTMSGIAVGMVALTLLGSMAALATAGLAEDEALLAGRVNVSLSGQGSGLVPPATMSNLRRVAGVAAVYPTVQLSALTSPPLLGGGPTIVASARGDFERSTASLSIQRGRQLDPSSTGTAVLGSRVAADYGLSVGELVSLPIRSAGTATAPGTRRYRVVGILNATLGAPDQWVELSLRDAQALLAAPLPRPPAAVSTLATSADVYAHPGTDLDALAGRIAQAVPGVQAISPEVSRAALRQISRTYEALTTGAALVALVVAGLSVVNTMLMSVSDRVREIGIKRALGATRLDVTAEVLAESAALALIGGLLGLGAGSMLVEALNAVDPGQQLFLLTPQLAAAVPLFAVALGLAAGVAPAARAAGLDPAVAVRSRV